MLQLSTNRQWQRSKAYLSIAFFIVFVQTSIAQSITGPTCVLAGQSYQYTYSGSWNPQPPNQSNFTWQLVGGVFTGTQSNSKSGVFPNVNITWSTSGTITLDVTNPTSHIVVNVTVTTPLIP